MNEKNAVAFQSQGVIIYIERQLEKLETANRPISRSVPISRLFGKREGYYVAASDKKIENDEAAEKTAEKIITEIFG